MVLHLPHWMEETGQVHSSVSIFTSGVGYSRGLSEPRGPHWAVHAQCFEWGFSGNDALQSLVGGADFVGQRFKWVEFHPPHSYGKKRE